VRFIEEGGAMKRILLVLLLVGLVGFVFSVNSYGCVCSDLSGWHYGGDVSTVGCAKVLGDDGASWSYLYRFMPEGKGTYRLSFDFKNEISSVAHRGPDFDFFDTFYATVYFTNSCSRFDLENCSCGYALSLFDLNYEGPDLYHGTVSQSARGDDWLHFDVVFVNYFHKIIPTFELFDMNNIEGDSRVLIADLSISQVPIPGTIFLLGAGLAGLFGIRTRNKPNQI